MNTQRIRYMRTLNKEKRRLSKQLHEINNEIIEMQNACNHIPASLYYEDLKCIICGKQLESEDECTVLNNSKIISICGYDESVYGDDYCTFINKKTEELQNIILKMLEEDYLSNDEIIDKINEMENAKKLIKK